MYAFLGIFRIQGNANICILGIFRVYEDILRVVTTRMSRALFESLFWHNFGRGGADVLRGGDMRTFFEV